MDLDQVNHVEREPVLPIAFSLFHLVQIEDGSATMLGAGADGLRRRRGPSGWASPSTTTASTARSTRWSTSASATTTPSASTWTRCSPRPSAGSPGSTPPTLTEVVVARPFPPQIASTYSARVAGEAGITRLDGTECWIYQHGLRHMGEIEHARALVGLAGHDLVSGASEHTAAANRTFAEGLPLDDPADLARVRHGRIAGLDRLVVHHDGHGRPILDTADWDFLDDETRAADGEPEPVAPGPAQPGARPLRAGARAVPGAGLRHLQHQPGRGRDRLDRDRPADVDGDGPGGDGPRARAPRRPAGDAPSSTRTATSTTSPGWPA